MSSDELPSIGVALNKKGTQGTRNNNKVALWSAVALQQHFRKQGACSVVPGMTDEKGAPVAINTSRLPPPQQHGQLTLAQKMGLVPPPPKEPTMEGWQITEQRALLREKLQPLGEQLCGICLEPFYATREEGQVILSCSHVFHEKCFKTFERLTRQRMREEGGDTAIRLACPECRETHYHKKKYFASKALAQRTALVKMQAVVRGFLARRRYTTLRLQSDDTFRGEYAKTRLEKLSRSWERYLSELDKLRESVLLDTDVVKQTAAAAYLSEKDWQAIIQKRTEMDSDYVNIGSVDPSTVLRETAEVCKKAGLPFHQCAICLDVIQRHMSEGTTGPETVEADAGARYVDAMRKEYEERRRTEERGKLPEAKKSRPKATTKKKPSGLPKSGASSRSHSKTRTTEQRDRQEEKAKAPSKVASGAQQEESNRGSVILSCSHCFHDACLSTFEHYNEWLAMKEGNQSVNKCPLCRSGYAKHPF